MISTTPKVSVIISTFNRAKFLTEAIDSVLAQTYTNFEIIVVDDGSTDNTREVLRKYESQIRYFYQQNSGVSAAKNFAMRISRGEYIAFLDDDDLWLPKKLETQIKVLEENPAFGFVCSESYVIGASGEITDHWRKGHRNQESFDSLRNENFILLLTVIARRKCVDAVGGFDPALKISQDYDLWLRLAKKFSFHYIEQPLGKYRRHTQNISKNTNARLQDHLRIFSKPEINSDWTIFQRLTQRSQKYYQFGELLYQAKDYSNAGINYLKSILHYPFIGTKYWPQESERIKFSLPYRILKVYLLTIECFAHAPRKKEAL